MATTPKHDFELPTLNGDDGQWGEKLNNNFSALDDKLDLSKALVVEAPTASEDLSFFFTQNALTVRKIRPVLVGASPSVTWTLKHDTDRSAAGNEIVTGGTVTTDTGTGSDITTFDDGSIPANSHVWFETTDKSGTVASISITLIYTED